MLNMCWYVLTYGLTKEEELKCWEAFSAFDKDSSGYIDSHELRIVLESELL